MITDWLIAIGTIALAILAVFQDKIRARLMQPKLDISMIVAPPDCHKTTIASSRAGQIIDKAYCYYFRFRVKNAVGSQRAELVEVYAYELLKQQADGSFKKMDSFLPMNLLWSHIGKPFFDAISPGMEKHCDLGHIIEPSKRSKFPMEDFMQEDYSRLDVTADKTIFSLDLEVKPFTMSHLIPPGKYHLVLLIGAANTKPIKRIFEITITGNWYDDEIKMFENGIGIRIL